MRKDEFIAKYHAAKKKAAAGTVTKIVVGVKLPTGASEIIINTEQIEEKYSYYLNAYDDDMCLKANSAVKIVDCMFL